MVPVSDISFLFQVCCWNVTWNTTMTFHFQKSVTLQHNWRKMQLIWSEWKKSSVQSWGGVSHSRLLCFISYNLWVMVLMTHYSALLCVVGFVGGCFVLPADSSPPCVGPGRCRGVTTLINCLLSPVCVASCLPCRHVLQGFRVVGWQWKTGGGSWRGEGRGGLLRRRQPCLSEQQCCCVEHRSRLAWAWQGSGLGYRCLPFTALLCAEYKD